MEAAEPTPAGAGLDTCACKRGFFTLRDCENAATATCDICSRRVCAKHLAPRVGATVCVECAAKQEEDRRAADEHVKQAKAYVAAGSPVQAGDGSSAASYEPASPPSGDS